MFLRQFFVRSCYRPSLYELLSSPHQGTWKNQCKHFVKLIISKWVKKKNKVFLMLFHVQESRNILFSKQYLPFHLLLICRIVSNCHGSMTGYYKVVHIQTLNGTQIIQIYSELIWKIPQPGKVLSTNCSSINQDHR